MPHVPVLVFCAVAAAPTASRVEDDALDRLAAGSPELRMLVGEALTGSPDLQALGSLAAAARVRPAQAGALADPMFGVTYTNEGWSPSLGSMPDTTLALMLTQALPWPGTRDLRTRAAEAEAAEAEQALARARLSVAASVARAYHGLVQARLLLALVREQGELWRQIEGVARARYEVGQGAQQDILRTQVEVTRVGQLEAEQQAEETVRLAELGRLLGREVALAAAPAAAGLAPPEPLVQVLERLRALSPELAAARIGVERARLAVQLAGKRSRPDLALQAGYMNRGGLEPLWQAGIGVTLPRRGPRAAARAEAEALLRAAEQRLRAAELQLLFRTQERLARLQAIERATHLYDAGIVPQDRLSMEAAVANYQAGRVPFLSVLEALATLYVDRGTLVRLAAGGALARVALEEASLDAALEGSAMSGGMGGVPSMAARALDVSASRSMPAGERPGAPMNR